MEENGKMAAYDGHATKRQRTEDSYGVQKGSRDSFEDPHKPSPSAVLHVRGLGDNISDTDIIEAVQPFGPVSYVLNLTRKRQALVEFEDINGAVTLMKYSQNSPVYIGGRPALFNYSTSQKIQRQGQGDEKPNNVLLFTVLNPKYPINVDVLNTICSANGTVNRVVIFKKSGVQAMVEFETVEAAVRAKQALNGADIYSGCCTLKIDYAKPTRLNVYKNDGESWDFTNPGLSGRDQPGGPPSRGAPLLAEPRYGSAPTPYGGSGPGPGGPEPRGRGPPPPSHGGASMDYGQHDLYDNYSRQERYPPPPQDRYPQPDQYGPPPPSHQQRYDPYSNNGPQHQYESNHSANNAGGGGPPGAGMYQQGSVLMVYGLHAEKMNCQKLFNLFCLYGNVVRCKYLKTKEGVAMVQMGDTGACERSLKNLHNVYFYGNKLQLGYSKQAFLQDVPNPHDMPDGTPSFQDFMGNRNNRFTTPETAAKNRILPPSKVLHYYNAPPNFSEEELVQVFEEAGCKAPVKIKQFPSRSEKSSTGLLEWESKPECLESLVCGNHANIPNPNGKHPYAFKLCFSANPISG